MYNDNDIFYIDAIIAAIMDMNNERPDFFDTWEEEMEIMQWLFDRRAGVSLWELSVSATESIAFIITHNITDNMVDCLDWFMKARAVPVNTEEETKLLEEIVAKRKEKTA